MMGKRVEDRYLERELVRPPSVLEAKSCVEKERAGGPELQLLPNPAYFPP